MSRLSEAFGAKAAALPELEQASAKLGPGRMVLVVGPSGAGKDTLLDGLKVRLAGRPGLHFARRQITRSADAGSEDHDRLSEADFDRMVSSGDMALAWRAHGLGYLIPASCDDVIRAGGTVIANGSRRALPQACAKYAHPLIMLVTAPVPVLAERLAARGRESRVEIEARLAQSDLEVRDVPDLIRINNTGSVEDGVAAMLAALDLHH